MSLGWLKLWRRSAPFIVLVLASSACASQAPAPAVAKRPSTVAPSEPADPPEISAYEQRWQSACTGEEAGGCPAPFDRPGAFFGVDDENDFAPPGLCDVGAQLLDEATATALSKARKALRACFRGAGKSAWVDVAADAKEPVIAAAGTAQRSVDCVVKIVRRSLSAGASAQRVVVLSSGTVGKDEPALSKDSVSVMINAHAGEISSCYDGALAVWPGLRGRHRARVVVWFDGSVALVRTQESSLGNAALECCINSAIRSWQFGAPEDGNIVLVTLPFLLGPKDSK
jgi:hypothetical protein